MDPLRGSTRLPIFKDDRTFSDRHGRGFMDGGLSDADWGLGGRMNRSAWDDDFDRICDDFYQMKPSTSRRMGPLGGLRGDNREHRLSPDVTDGGGGNIVEDPNTRSRRFQISFNVSEYEPKEIALRVEGENLYVEAKHETIKDGSKTISEFSRCVKIPKEVDAEKLTSDLSSDGILTVKAPVPPGYHTVGSQPPHDSLDNSGPGATSELTQATPILAAPPQHTDSQLAPGAGAAPKYTSTVFHQPTLVSQSESPSPNTSAGDRATSPPGPQALDVPVFTSTQQGRRMDLIVVIEHPYTPEDLMVKVEGDLLMIEACHEHKIEGKRTSKSTMSREFQLDEKIDPNTVQASLGTDGKLRIIAKVK